MSNVVVRSSASLEKERDLEQVEAKRLSRSESKGFYGGGITTAPVDMDEKELDEYEEVIRAETEFTERDYKKLMWKVDGIMMPLLMITYGLQYSDKTSLASGSVFGLREDTKLVGNQYANLTTFFYMTYAIAQLPMGYALQRFPLGKALGTTVVTWGAMVMLLGACNNYWQLSIVRVLLGWFESVITPGFAVLTASWYLRKEQTLRQGMYYAMNTFFGIVFGVGIYFIADNAQKRGGIAAWRVINLFLGGVTVGIGILLLIFIGTPDEVWWLNKREKLMAKARIVSNATGGGETHSWKWEQVKECFKDRQYWHAVSFNFLACVPNGGLTTFNYLVFQSFGFTSLETILYGLPAAGIGCFFIVLSCIVVRYYERFRFPVAIVTTLIPTGVFLFVGLAPADMNKWIKWGVFSFYPLYTIATFLVWPLMSINIAGRTKKTFFGASSLICYCIGNIVGSQIFIPKDAPKYLHGLTACAIVMCVNCCNLGAWWWYYRSENKRRDRIAEASGLTAEQQAHDGRLAGESDLTDKQNLHFRYSC